MKILIKRRGDEKQVKLIDIPIGRFAVSPMGNIAVGTQHGPIWLDGRSTANNSGLIMTLLGEGSQITLEI
jgi:hypothetical protein